MPQTKNFGFPLWADTPPEGATGKELRDAILGEGDGSLASMVDAELERVKRSIPPVDKNTFNVEWDGSTAGRVKANGSYKYTMKFGTTVMGDIALQYYKVYDEPVISKSTLTGSGKAYVTYNKVQFSLDFGFKINGEREFSKVSDKVYICLANGTEPATSEGAILALFSVLEGGAVYSSADGTLTFPEKGLYAVKAQSYDARLVSLFSEEAAYYDPDTMPDTVMELVSHKVTEIGEESTDREYPSARAVWNALNDSAGGGGISGIKVNGTAAVPEDSIVDITVPTKVSELENDAGYATEEAISDRGYETEDQKVGSIIPETFSDAGNVNSFNYPSTGAVYNFVTESLAAYQTYIYEDLFQWDGDPEGLDTVDIAGLQFCKISDSTAAYEQILVDLKAYAVSEDGTREEEDMAVGVAAVPEMTEIFSQFGITLYAVEDIPAVLVADRDGVITAEELEAILGADPGFDISYSAGTFLLNTDFGGGVYYYAAAVKRCTPVKEYIDSKFDELRELTGSKESGT